MKPTMTIEDINRAIHDGVTAPIICIDAFLEHVTKEASFDALYALLDSKAQGHVTELAQLNIHDFDDIVSKLTKRGDIPLLESWTAYKEWAERQPWVEEARARPQPIPWTEEQTQTFLDAEYAEGMANVARFFLERGRGTPEEARLAPIVAELDASAARLAALAEEVLPPRAPASDDASVLPKKR
jgi:hypothetical protein